MGTAFPESGRWLDIESCGVETTCDFGNLLLVAGGSRHLVQAFEFGARHVHQFPNRRQRRLRRVVPTALKRPDESGSKLISATRGAKSRNNLSKPFVHLRGYGQRSKRSPTLGQGPGALHHAAVVQHPAQRCRSSTIMSDQRPAGMMDEEQETPSLAKGPGHFRGDAWRGAIFDSEPARREIEARVGEGEPFHFHSAAERHSPRFGKAPRAVDSGQLEVGPDLTHLAKNSAITGREVEDLGSPPQAPGSLLP